MAFSELRLLEDETGLVFSDDYVALCGKLNGFGAMVSDTGELYCVKIFCVKPYLREKEAAAAVSACSSLLPKNALLRQRAEMSYILAELDKFSLLQENAVCLSEFLKSLTQKLSEMGLTGTDPLLPRLKKTVPEKPDERSVKVKLGFDIRSVLGVLGALIGAAAMSVIFALLTDPLGEINVFALTFEISAYCVAAISSVVIFADYRFLAKKLDACGVLSCPVISFLCVFLSGTGAGAKAAAALEKTSFADALTHLPAYLERHEELDKFLAGFLSRGMLAAFFSSLLICFFYFRRHPEETVLSVKSAKKS